MTGGTDGEPTWEVGDGEAPSREDAADDCGCGCCCGNAVEGVTPGVTGEWAALPLSKKSRLKKLLAEEEEEEARN